VTILQGICKGGPLDGKVRAGGAKTFAPAGHGDKGFYVARPAQGPTPASWLWVPNKKDAVNEK
jgi:hypothetical protein